MMKDSTNHHDGGSSSDGDVDRDMRELDRDDSLLFQHDRHEDDGGRGGRRAGGRRSTVTRFILSLVSLSIVAVLALSYRTYYCYNQPGPWENPPLARMGWRWKSGREGERWRPDTISGPADSILPSPVRIHHYDEDPSANSYADNDEDDGGDGGGGHTSPTFLSLRDPWEGRNELVDVDQYHLYDVLLSDTTSFQYPQEEGANDGGGGREGGRQEQRRREEEGEKEERRSGMVVALGVNKREIEFHDSLTITWDIVLPAADEEEADEDHGEEGDDSYEAILLARRRRMLDMDDAADNGGSGRASSFQQVVAAPHDDDVLALYCGNMSPDVVSSTVDDGVNPRQFVEAVTIGWLRRMVLHQQEGEEDDTSSPSQPRPQSRIDWGRWTIDSFPIVRKEYCEFYYWKIVAPAAGGTAVFRRRRGNNGGRSNDTDGATTQVHHRRYELAGRTGPIRLRKALTYPTAIHLGLLDGGGSHSDIDDSGDDRRRTSTTSSSGMRVHFTTGGHLISMNKADVTKLVREIEGEETNDDGDGAVVTAVLRDDDDDDTVVIPVVRYKPIHPSATGQYNGRGSKGVTGGTIELRQWNRYTIIRGTSTSYDATDMCMAPANVTSPSNFVHPGLIHTVDLTNLTLDTEYEYEVGLRMTTYISNDDDDGDDDPRIHYSWHHHKYTFRTPPPVGPTHDPFHFLVYGDQGCPETGWTRGAKTVMDRLKREVGISKHHHHHNHSHLLETSTLRMVHHIGDLSYARGHAYLWDFWFHMIQPMASRLPLMVAMGNHEYDHKAGGGDGKDPSGIPGDHGFEPTWGNFGNDSGGECGVPVSKRFLPPLPSSGNGVFWYSYDYASVHVVVLSSEHDLSEGSTQFQWLRNDLNMLQQQRDVTPWLIVELHRPLYNSYELAEEDRVGMAMRNEFEVLLRDYNVDLVLSGHYHSYLRTCGGLYRGLCHNGGPTHITIGTAGAKLTKVPLYQQHWTRMALSEWGYGRITVMNATSLLFEFISDDDDGTPHDLVLLSKD